VTAVDSVEVHIMSTEAASAPAVDDVPEAWQMLPVDVKYSVEQAGGLSVAVLQHEADRLRQLQQTISTHCATVITAE